MSDTDINVTLNVSEDVYPEVDATAMSAAVVDDGDSIVVPAEVDFGDTLDTELEDEELIDVPINESVGIEGDHRLLLHRDAANQHPMSAITGLDDALAGINTALSDRIGQVETENAELEVNMTDALLRIGDLQNQVDGNITTWFYAAEPSMNLPPVALDPSNPHDTGWDTVDKKNAHRGDLYYNTITGYAYRFAYADGDYGWMRITDTDVVKALADAARAQDTADSKRRVFYTTPYPPYDKGDLWVQGGSGDILVCSTSKPADGSYDFADWSRASKYTDDTVADIALASANGKNTVYHQASQPTGGTYKKGDTWFDTDDDYTMYTYDGSLWIKEQFGNEAIADLSITNAKIKDATIEYAKIKSVDAGKITVGDISADRMKVNSISAINGNTGTVKISADKVNIQGVITAINNDTTTTIDGDKITTGTLSASAVDASSGTFNTANIPNLNANKITAGDISADRLKVNSIQAINSNTGTLKISANKINITGSTTLSDGWSINDIAQDKVNKIEGLSVTMTVSGSNLIFRAVLVQGGTDITNTIPDGDFEWFYRTPSGDVPMNLNGKSITIAQSSQEYGRTVVCVWTRNQYAYLLDNNGNNLVTNTGAKLIGRSEY